MDDIDSKVLTILARDARISWADLGAALGLSAPAAAERVHRLEASGVVRGYEARIDARAVDCTVTAFVAVTLGRQRDRADIVRRIEETPEILECHHVAGEHDFLLKVRCRDTDALEHLLTGVLKAHDGVARTHTTIALSTVKETSVPPTLATPSPTPTRKRGRR